MAVDLPTPGPNDKWGAQLNAGVRSVDARVVTLEETGGPPGPEGKSAYEVWLEAGNTGTVDDYLASLVGPPGVDGQDGDPGREVLLRLNENGIEWQHDGDTGWQVLVTLAEITGPPGTDGTDGADSTVPGPDGDSAYQVWLNAGNSGTVDDFLASLVGAKGDKGDPGATTIDGIDGLQAALDDRYTKAQADARYYTQAQVDQAISAAIDAAFADAAKVRAALGVVTIDEGDTAPAGISIVRPA